MSRQSFSELLKKYLEGNTTDEETTFIEHWYSLLGEDNSSQSLSDKELEERLWIKIQTKTQPRRKRYLWLWTGTAASILLFVTIFFWQNSTTNEWMEQKNTTLANITISLEDGSTVVLYPNSTLKFPKEFEKDKREVHLKGNAFFDIGKMPEKPFFVYTQNLTTKVLGTSFYVWEDEKNHDVRIEVKTGKVELIRNKQPTNVILTRNHKAIYSETQKQIKLGIIDQPSIETKTDSTGQENLVLSFTDAKLPQVLAKLEQAYGIGFKIQGPHLENCLLTANLNNQPLETQLEIICTALDTKYKLQGTTISLQGKGCH